VTGQNDVAVTLSCFIDSSSEEEVGRPTKLSQFLKAPLPTQEKPSRPSSGDARKDAKSDRSEGDKRRDRQTSHKERSSDREYANTQQRLLALAEYSDQPSNDRDSRNGSRQTGHSTSHGRKNARSPGHRRH